mgnify:CR=1 FL=1
MPTLWLIAELGCGILLLAVGNLITARRTWDVAGVDYSSDLGIEALAIALAFVPAIVKTVASKGEGIDTVLGEVDAFLGAREGWAAGAARRGSWPMRSAAWPPTRTAAPPPTRRPWPWRRRASASRPAPPRIRSVR